MEESTQERNHFYIMFVTDMFSVIKADRSRENPFCGETISVLHVTDFSKLKEIILEFMLEKSKPMPAMAQKILK